MPALVAVIWGAFLNILGSAVGQVMVALGISVVTYTGVDFTLGWLKTFALGQLSGMPAGAVSLMAYMKVGVCINMLFSAMVMRMTLNGFTSGTFKRFVKS